MPKQAVRLAVLWAALIICAGCSDDSHGSNVNGVNSVGAPAISNVQPLVSTDQIAIEWDTDRPATSQLIFGVNPGAYTSGTTEDFTLVNQHHINLVYLAANTTYYFKVISVDADHNSAISDEKTFFTLN